MSHCTSNFTPSLLNRLEYLPDAAVFFRNGQVNCMVVVSLTEEAELEDWRVITARFRTVLEGRRDRQLSVR